MTPLKVAGSTIILNIILDWALSRFLDVGGLALSTSLVALFNIIVLIIILRKKIGNFGGKRIFMSYAKMAASVAIMSVIVFFLWGYLEKFACTSTGMFALNLIIVIIVGAGVYIGCTILFRMEEIKFVLELFKSRRKIE
jgi:putative peptidoglycan lipid II flippase